MSQDIAERRTYIIRPKEELIHYLDQLGEADLIDFLSAPSVVMTEALPFEAKLEGYRPLILRKCKERFIHSLLEFTPFSDIQESHLLFGTHASPVEMFDAWWIAEEAGDTIEIETDW